MDVVFVGLSMKEPEGAGGMAGAQSVDRALRLLPLIGRSPEQGIPLSAIVEETGLSRPTVRRLLLALIRARLVEQNPRTRAYMLGEEAYVLGLLAARRFSLLDFALSSVVRLADASGDTAFVSARRDSFAVCLHKEDGSFPIRTHALQVGYRHPLGIGGGALAMLAALSDAEAEEMLAQNAPLYARDYPTADPSLIRSLVADARLRGWALNPGLIITNSWGIGVALRLPDGRVAGALSIAAIDSRMTKDHQARLGELLRAEAGGVEKRLARAFTSLEPRPLRPVAAPPVRPSVHEAFTGDKT